VNGMRVALVNVVASNTGDAAILLALQRVLRRALGDDTQFSVFHRHPRTADPRTSDGEVYEEPQASLVGTAGNSAVTTLQQRRVLNAARRPALRVTVQTPRG
jgi:polysaccharide pyruvyl transferase WcaK-like protein